MAHVYVYSGAAGAGTGADWTNAYTTLAAALTAKAAGDQFWVANDHAETQASAMTLTAPSTDSAPCTVACVLRTGGTVPPVAADLRTTATVTTTGNSAMTIQCADTGRTFWYGIAFNCGSGAVSAGLTVYGQSQRKGHYFKNCALKKNGTSGSNSAIHLGSTNLGDGNEVYLDNTTLGFGSTSDGATVSHVRLMWFDTTSAITGSVPTTLFPNNYPGGEIYIKRVDLSAVSGSIFASGAGAPRTQVVEDSRLHASTGFGGANNAALPRTYIIRSDSAATNYRHEKYDPFGSQAVETTIVRTGGASDGTTPIAWKIVTTSNAEYPVQFFESMPLAIWVDVTTSVTLTIYGIWGGGAVPDNDDLWMEVGYLGDASYPLGSVATTQKATFLTASAGYATDSSTWGGSTTKFKLEATFTPAMKGYVSLVIKAALASSTFYIDPKPVVT